MESGDFFRAWGGISSLQLTLSTVWTEARDRGLGLELLAKWLSRNPAKLAGWGDRKGKIEAGSDADLVVWNPERHWTVDKMALEHRHKLTPYDGVSLWGGVERTYVRGQLVFADGRFATQNVGLSIQRQRQ